MRKAIVVLSVIFLAACSDAVESSGLAIAKAQEVCHNFGGIKNLYTKRPFSRESYRTSVVTCQNDLVIQFITDK